MVPRIVATHEPRPNKFVKENPANAAITFTKDRKQTMRHNTHDQPQLEHIFQ